MKRTNMLLSTHRLQSCLIFLGAPGVGKGTFSKILCKDMNMEHIALGDIIRQEIKTGQSQYAKKFQDCVKAGKLIPDEYVNEFALDRIQNTKKNIILDGYPRTIQQAEFLEKQVGNSFNIKALHITLDREVTMEKLLSRMVCTTCKDEFNSAHIMTNGYDMPALLPNPQTCKLGSDKCNPVMEQRVDDTKETIVKRFEEYDAKTKPLIDFYTSRNAMETFAVKKGKRDAPDLMQLIKTKLNVQ